MRRRRRGQRDGTTSLVTIGDGDCYGTSNSHDVLPTAFQRRALAGVGDKISFDASPSRRLDTSWGSNTTAWAARTRR